MKIGIVSDIHEDIKSLEQAFSVLAKKKCDKIVCLGDIVGYSLGSLSFRESRNASKCISEIQKNADVVVIGNHDLFNIRKLPKHKADISYPESWYELDFFQRKKLAKGKIWLYEEKELYPLLTSSNKEYLMKLNEFKMVKVEGFKICFSHNIYPDLSGSLTSFPDTYDNFDKHFNFLAENDCLISFHGHMHAEGAIIGSLKKLKHREFGIHKLRKKPQAIIGPAVAQGHKSNGCMVFDTNTFILEVIPLKSKKLKVS